MSATLGDFDASAVVYGKFTTYRPSTGAPFTLGGTPALSVYKDNSTTQSTAGVTLTADFDSVTGLNHFAVDTSADGTFYSAGSFFDVVVTTGSVDSVSAVGSVVGRFTIRKTSALKPTTAGRTLDVSAGGEAGLDWANVGSPTTTLNLSGTTISTSQAVASVTGAVGSVTGNVGGSVASVAAAGITASSIATGAITSAKFAAGAIDSAAIATDAIGSAQIAASAVTEIQSGLATAANLAVVAGYLDTEIAAILADTDALEQRLTATRAGYLDNLSGGAVALASALANAAAMGSDYVNNSTLNCEMTGTVGGVLGDVNGKVLGTAAGGGTISGIGAWALGSAGATVSTLDAAGVRAAVGLASANLDTQLGTIDTVADSILADTGTDGVVLSTATCQRIAHILLRRTMTNVEASADGDALDLSSLYGLIQMAQEASVSGTTMTVRKSDGVSVLGTKSVTTNASADPITGVS